MPRMRNSATLFLTYPLLTTMTTDADVVIVGAGPAGLSLALSLAQAGLQVAVLEQQSEAQLAEPAPDGREIALTHPSMHSLQRLGIWQRLQPHERGFVEQAIVHDGHVGQHPTLNIHPLGTDLEMLGGMVPNHAIRRSAWEEAAGTEGLELITEASVHQVQVYADYAEVHYTQQHKGLRADAPSLKAPLVVAADSRFSQVRRMLGVGVHMHDTGRSVLVCRMQHKLPHYQVAHECFGYQRTLAILPLLPEPGMADDEHQCSVVITSDNADIQHLSSLDADSFAQEVEALFQHRLGEMALTTPRHSYPLIATYAQRFSGQRFALLGDAAIGMHPVTAHGFNLGLSGMELLSQTILAAFEQGFDWGNAASLQGYANTHHRHAWPIYQGTNAIVRLFTDQRPLPRLLRQAVLRGAEHFPPVKLAIVSQLSGHSPWRLLQSQWQRLPFLRR